MATRRANVLGLGLIGGSLALALAKHGFVVSGSDANGEVEQSALARGVIGAVGIDPLAEISFIATPVSSIPDQAKLALSKTRALSPTLAG